MNGLSSVFHVGGLVSGLNTDDLIAKMVSLDSGPINDAKSRQKDITDSQAAWKSLSAQMLALKTSADRLALPGSFTTYTATASDPQAVTVTTDSAALPGTLSVSVKQLAMRNQILSTGYDDSTSAQVGTGTLQLSLGAATYEPITIDASNNTLQGVVNAINKQASGVQASLVNDGQSTGGWHLLLTSRNTGAANQITVSGDLGSAISFTTLQPAQDAKVILGGQGGTPLTVTSSTNSVTDALPGVSLQLLHPEDNMTINVAQDTSAIKSMINNFVSNYNTIAQYYQQNMYYDPGPAKCAKAWPGQ